MTRLPLSAMALGLALPLQSLAPGVAEAQTAACRGRIFVDSVYQNGLGSNRYEYNVILRNGTPNRMTLQLNFANFGPAVTLFSPQLTGIALGPNSSQTIRFGNGTNGNINAGTVTTLYDAPPAAGRPSVAVTNCR